MGKGIYGDIQAKVYNNTLRSKGPIKIHCQELEKDPPDQKTETGEPGKESSYIDINPKLATEGSSVWVLLYTDRLCWIGETSPILQKQATDEFQIYCLYPKGHTARGIV